MFGLKVKKRPNIKSGGIVFFQLAGNPMAMETVFSKMATKNHMENGVGISLDGQTSHVMPTFGLNRRYMHCAKLTTFHI